MGIEYIPVNTDGSDKMIGIVVARFNEYAGKEELAACLDELKKLGVQDDNITVVSVPGALEIPFALSKMINFTHYDALIALGAVIRGETYHFEIVSNQMAAGIAEVASLYDVPVANGVLTTENDEQCKARTDMKGRDCARCAVEMACLSDVFPSEDELYEEDEE